MPAYSINSKTNASVTGPKLKKGRVKITTTTDIFWVIGENPVARSTGCAILRAGKSVELNLPVNCSRLAVLAVTDPGAVSILDITGGARASCSA